MNLVKISVACLGLLVYAGQVDAQSKEKTKIVVIEKTTDENGKVVTQRIEKSGEEAEKYLKEKKEELGVEIDMEGDRIEMRKEIKVEVNSEDIDKEKSIKIRVKDDEGEEVELEWDGEGEMPEEMRKYMKENELQIDIEKEIDEIMVTVESDSKPRLGVYPENHVDGVEVLDVIEGTPAEEAGLKEGDVIYEINGMTVGSTLQLSDRLKKVEEGSAATILYLRDGKKMKAKVTL